MPFDISRIAEALASNEYGAVTLGHLVDALESVDQEMVVADGFGEPDSWRGVYAFLAFEPVENAKASEMLKFAKNAIGKVFIGYKGGNFTMTRSSPVFIDRYGECNDEAPITPERLKAMLGLDAIPAARPSNMPKRPAVLEYVVHQGDNWLQIIPRDRWAEFRQYVSTLEGLAKRPHHLPDWRGYGMPDNHVAIIDSEWDDFQKYVAGLESKVAKIVE